MFAATGTVVSLKVKSLIYRYTGFYLANKEESDYLKSKECWSEISRIVSSEENDMSPRSIQGLLVGMWQCKHGFARPSVSWGWPSRNPLIKVAASLTNSSTALWWDLRRMFK